MSDHMTTDKDAVYDSLIQDAINFMQSMTEYYGNDRAMESWNLIAQALGDEVRTDIFMTLLEGGSRKIINLSRTPENSPSAIGVIKAIRSVTGLGLKEAKDLWDLSARQAVRITLDSAASKTTAIRDFRNLGMRAF